MIAPVIPDDGDGIARALEILRGGGIVALPTDTVYGIAVGLTTPHGIERLFAAKRRPLEKAIVVLVDGLDQVVDLVDLPRAASVLADAGWPGGLTLVLPLRDVSRLPAALTAGTATLGVRVPGHPTPRAIARAVGPLPTTSANRSGAPDSRDAEAVAAALGEDVDLILDGGPTRGGISSTVVDCTLDPPRILRAGAIGRALLEAALHGVGMRLDPDSGPG